MGYGELDISQAETAGIFAPPPMFITFRETLEAAIVIGVLLGLLNKLNLPHLKRYVWLGCLSAGAMVVVFGVIVVLIISVAKESLFEGNDRHFVEGIISVVAAFLIGIVALTIGDVMAVQRKIEAKMEESIHEQGDIISKKLILFLSFTTVAREGLEMIIFFIPIVAAFETKAIPLPSFVGIVLGLIIGYGLFRFGGKMSIVVFMRFTMVMMVFIGAGVWVYGIGELQRTGAFGTWEPESERPPLNQAVFDITDCCGLNNQFWVLMRVLFGYTPVPTPLEIILYFSYHALIWSLLYIKYQRAKAGKPPMKHLIKYYLCYPCKRGKTSKTNKPSPSKEDEESSTSLQETDSFGNPKVSSIEENTVNKPQVEINIS